MSNLIINSHDYFPFREIQANKWAKNIEEAAQAFKTDRKTISAWLKSEGNPGLSKRGWLDLNKWRPWVRFSGRSWFRKKK